MVKSTPVIVQDIFEVGFVERGDRNCHIRQALAEWCLVQGTVPNSAIMLALLSDDAPQTALD